jgi:hypothetical protein
LAAYAAAVEVDAVILSGSVARGHADRWSDVEIGVFWAVPPSEDRRRQLATTARNCRLFPYDDAERWWADDLELEPNGLLTEVVHMLTTDAEAVVHDVTREFEPDPAKRNVVAGILDGQPAAGDALIRNWQQRATPYPRELAAAVVDATGMIDHFSRWRMLHERDNPLQLAQMFSTSAKQMIDMLMAVNGRYGPKPEKWLALIATDASFATNVLQRTTDRWSCGVSLSAGRLCRKAVRRRECWLRGRSGQQPWRSPMPRNTGACGSGAGPLRQGDDQIAG